MLSQTRFYQDFNLTLSVIQINCQINLYKEGGELRPS